MIVQKVKCTAEFIPIRRVLKTFFELPQMYEKTMTYYNSLIKNESIISHFVQGAFWREKLSTFGNRITLPLFLYYDDYEPNNPLSSHAGTSKCGAIYVSTILPPEIESKLYSVFLFVLVNTLDYKVFKNEIIFHEVLKELAFLENEGITIEHSTGSTHLYFSLALVLGDNLDIHSVLGFVEGFNAHFYCRFCLTENKFVNDENNFNEMNIHLWTKDEYEKFGLQYGVCEKGVFNILRGFHVTENLSVDAMHDLLEGICQYDLSKILNHFIVSGFFSVEQLNDGISGMQFKCMNKPPEISKQHLERNKLKMSSAEMLSLMTYLGLIVGDLIPQDNDYWRLYILLKRILDIVRLKHYHPDIYHYFGVLIEEYLMLLNKLFPDNSIKPKHHFLVHYPRIMYLMGPLWKLSSMKYERKHQSGKAVSRVARCRINVC